MFGRRLARPVVNLRSSISALVLDRRRLALAFDELEVTGRALERGEPARAATPPLDAPPARARRQRSRSAHDAAQNEGAEPSASLDAIHEQILRFAR